MYIKISKKHMGIGLLICCLFLTSYLSILNTTGTIFSNQNGMDTSSIDGGSRHSSMDGGANYWQFYYRSAADTSISFPFSSIKQSRSQVSRINFNILTAIAAAQLICLIYSSRLSSRICTSFNSLRITIFLHKKDGMK